jgi:Transglutaminase-like superfamily
MSVSLSLLSAGLSSKPFATLSAFAKSRYGYLMSVLYEILRMSVRIVRLVFLGLELLAQIAFAAWTVRFVPFKLYSIGLKNDPLAQPPPVQLARDIRRIVDLVSFTLPERSKCLICGIAAKRVLARRAYSSELSFGVNPAATPMVAHAWLVAGSVIVTGRGEKGKFEEVVRL